MNIQFCYTGHNATWTKPGKRPVAVMIIAVNIEKNFVKVEETKSRKTRFVPAEELTAK